MNHRTLWVSLACCVFALAIAAAPAQSQSKSPGQNPPTPSPANPSKSSPTTPPYTPSTRSTTTPTATGDNDSFLNKAIEINAAEIQLGRMAASKTQNSKVKSYANMLVKDHTSGLEKFQKVQKGTSTTAAPAVQLSSEHESLRTKLSGLNGAEFDREYIDAMVSGHREAIGLFEREAGSDATTSSTRSTTAGRDSTSTPKTPAATAHDSSNSASNLAHEMLPTLKHHLSEAEQIQKSLASPASTTPKNSTTPKK